jgi:hypothetical protein
MTATFQPTDTTLATVGAGADAHAAAFGDYRSRKSPATIRRQDAALTAFASYLAAIRLPSDPSGWVGGQQHGWG